MRARHCKGKLRLEEGGKGIWGGLGEILLETTVVMLTSVWNGNVIDYVFFFKYLFYFLCVSVLPVWTVHCVCAVFVEVREGHLLPWNCPGIAVNCHVGAGNEI